MIVSAAKPFLRKAFSYPAFLVVALAAGTVLATGWEGVLGGRLFTQGDTWWHIAVGDQIIRTGTWPIADSYSYTAVGSPWVAYEWLGEALMALAMRWGGLQGLVILLAGTAVVLMLLLFYYASLRSGSVKAALIACAVVLPLAATLFALRPHLFGWVLLLMTLICLERFHQGKRGTLLLLPFIFLVWVNVHGSFPIGLFVIGLCWLGGLRSFSWGRFCSERWTKDQRRDLGVAFAACVPMLLITPYGFRPFVYPFEIIFMQRRVIAQTTEWAPLTLTEAPGQFFIALLIGFLLYQTLWRRRITTYRLDELILFLFAVSLTLLHQRFVLLAVLAFTPPLAAALASHFSAYETVRDRRLLNGALIALMVCGIVAGVPQDDTLNRELDRSYPRGAVDYLRTSQFSGRIMNEANWGGYLIWRSPEHQVFIDGRVDLYANAGVLDDYVRIMSLDPATPDLLRKYRVEMCMLNLGSPLGGFLKTLPGWQEVYSDGNSMLVARKGN